MEITLTIDRFEGDKAVLLTDTRHQIIWPRSYLPETVQEGNVFVFKIMTDQEAQADRDDLAKKILNEIMQK